VAEESQAANTGTAEEELPELTDVAVNAETEEELPEKEEPQDTVAASSNEISEEEIAALMEEADEILSRDPIKKTDKADI